MIAMFASFTAAILLALLACSLFYVQSALQRPNRILALLFAMLSTHMLLLTLRFWEGRTDAYGLTSVIAASIGPVFYSYFLAVLTDRKFDTLYFLRHGWLVALMIVLQWNTFGIPQVKDIVILASLSAYCAILLHVITGKHVTAPGPSGSASRIFRFLKFLVAFLIITTLLDYLIFFESLWLTDVSPQFALITAVVFLLVLSIAGTYVGLNRNQFISWLFTTKYSAQPAGGDFTADEKNEAIEKLQTLTETEQAHLDPAASVQLFAARMGVPPRLLSQAVNQHYNKGFRRVINDLRIEAAKEKLRSTNETILSIMFSVGFETKSNFNKEFYNTVGFSPSEYRKKNSD